MENKNIAKTSHGTLKEPRFWQCLSLLLGIICLVLLVIVIIFGVQRNADDKEIPTLQECIQLPVDRIIDLNEPENPPIFHDLTSREIERVFKFLYAQRDLNITEPSEASLGSNYIHSMELLLPVKKDAFQSSTTRKTLVTVFRGADKLPSVAEYCVELTVQPSFCGSPRMIPFNFRPPSSAEDSAIFDVLYNETTEIIGDLISESYKGKLIDCGSRCIDSGHVSPLAAVIAGVEGQGYRGLWVLFDYSMEPKYLYPLDFSVLMTMDGISTPKTSTVWYNGQIFDSLEDLKNKWNNNSVSRLSLEFPKKRIHDETVQKNYQRPPIEVEPDGKRYSIKDQTVTTDIWKFSFGISPTHGPQLYNVRYKDELIVYELGLQEIRVFYSSSEPFGRYANFFDSNWMIGRYIMTLVPGVDCPSHATFIDLTVMAETSNSPVVTKNAICVFEHNTASPLRRHHAPSERPSGYFEGAPNVVLITRVIATVVNYDYVFDFIFYQNGIVETKVTAAGIIASSFKTADKKYGFQVSDQALGTLHNHFFSFKVDLDIGGSMNSYSTYNVELDEAPNPFSRESPPSNMFQEKVVKVDYATERDAAYKFNFTTPKYHVFYNENNLDKYGNPRAYRLLAKGFAKQVLPEGVGNEPGSSWTRYQMAVTKRKETEPYSSSKYATYDGENRTVNFEDFIGDESIKNEDLVAWLTLGVHHIPRTEDLPIMTTPGTETSFLLMPFNYFSIDPSVGDKDNVRLHYKSATGPLELFMQNESNDLTCKPPKTYSVKDLTNTPEDFIQRPKPME